MNTNPPDNSFSLFLQHQRAGDCAAELSDHLRTLGIAVTSQGKKGKLILEITMEPTGRGAGTAVAIHDKITLKEPQEEANPAIFFVGTDGDLSRQDPRQRELDLRPMKGGKEDAQPETAAAKAS